MNSSNQNNRYYKNQSSILQYTTTITPATAAVVVVGGGGGGGGGRSSTPLSLKSEIMPTVTKIPSHQLPIESLATSSPLSPSPPSPSQTNDKYNKYIPKRIIAERISRRRCRSECLSECSTINGHENHRDDEIPQTIYNSTAFTNFKYLNDSIKNNIQNQIFSSSPPKTNNNYTNTNTSPFLLPPFGNSVKVLQNCDSKLNNNIYYSSAFITSPIPIMINDGDLSSNLQQQNGHKNHLNKHDHVHDDVVDDDDNNTNDFLYYMNKGDQNLTKKKFYKEKLNYQNGKIQNNYLNTKTNGLQIPGDYYYHELCDIDKHNKLNNCNYAMNNNDNNTNGRICYNNQNNHNNQIINNNNHINNNNNHHFYTNKRKVRTRRVSETEIDPKTDYYHHQRYNHRYCCDDQNLVFIKRARGDKYNSCNGQHKSSTLLTDFIYKSQFSTTTTTTNTRTTTTTTTTTATTTTTTNSTVTSITTSTVATTTTIPQNSTIPSIVIPTNQHLQNGISSILSPGLSSRESPSSQQQPSTSTSPLPKLTDNLSTVPNHTNNPHHTKIVEKHLKKKNFNTTTTTLLNRPSSTPRYHLKLVQGNRYLKANWKYCNNTTSAAAAYPKSTIGLRNSFKMVVPIHNNSSTTTMLVKPTINIEDTSQRNGDVDGTAVQVSPSIVAGASRTSNATAAVKNGKKNYLLSPNSSKNRIGHHHHQHRHHNHHQDHHNHHHHHHHHQNGISDKNNDNVDNKGKHDDDDYDDVDDDDEDEDEDDSDIDNELSDTDYSSIEDDADIIGNRNYHDSLSDIEDIQNQLIGNEDKSTTATTTTTTTTTAGTTSDITIIDNIKGKTTIDGMLTDCVEGNCSKTGPLSPSLFPNVSPYITFATHTEKGPEMPAAIHKVLKWKLTTITPIVVRKIILHTGFRLLRKTNDWISVWGRHSKSSYYNTIRSYQKINHFPGSFQIGRKDSLWRNLQQLSAKHGKKEFGFMPRTYIFPQDKNQLRDMWQKYRQRRFKWIVKPPASARGIGIKVVDRWSQIPKQKQIIVQRYIERPMLINGSKFDLRLYVLVTSINPLRIYLHTDGLARFASVKYSEKSKTLNDRYMHLTNYSINKLSANYAKNEDANACAGHKWTIKSLWTYLAGKDINVNGLWSTLRNLVLRTILAGENAMNQMTKLHVWSNYNCFEVFGIDVILDSELIPWLLEVNISPSLHSASPLDLHVKGPLVTAILNTTLYQVPPKIPQDQQDEIMKDLQLTGNLCYDKRFFNTTLSKSEMIKHNIFVHESIVNRTRYLETILQVLNPDDVRCLMISEDELARCSPLERIFPTQTTHKYLRFTQHPRYYNLLLDAWEHHYGGGGGGGDKRKDGIALLQSHAQNNFHLSVPQTSIRKGYKSNAKIESTISEDEETDDNSMNEIKLKPEGGHQQQQHHHQDNHQQQESSNHVNEKCDSKSDGELLINGDDNVLSPSTQSSPQSTVKQNNLNNADSLPQEKSEIISLTNGGHHGDHHCCNKEKEYNNLIHHYGDGQQQQQQQKEEPHSKINTNSTNSTNTKTSFLSPATTNLTLQNIILSSLNGHHQQQPQQQQSSPVPYILKRS